MKIVGFNLFLSAFIFLSCFAESIVLFGAFASPPKQAMSRGIASKQATEAKHKNGLKNKAIPRPATAPVVSPKGEEKQNFLNSVKKTIVEGEIVKRSDLPDPKKSDYPNCRFAVHFKGNTIISGEPCPKELVLVVEGFENYRILSTNNLKAGDKVLCAILPFDQLPEDYQSTQQADDLELFLLERYYVVDIKPIKRCADSELAPTSGIYFSGGNEEYISIFDRHINPPLPAHIDADQAFSIKKDKEKMAVLLGGIDYRELKKINRQFRDAWEREKAKDPPNYNRVAGIRSAKSYVWRNLGNSFWTLPEKYYGIMGKPDKLSQQVLDSFLSLKRALEANGVHLIVSLVPNMNEISARVILNEYKDFPDIQSATYVKQLSEIGIETIYASDQIIKNYNRYPFAYFIPEDSHPSDTVQDVLSDILADRLKRYGIIQDLDPSLFSVTQFHHTFGENKAFKFPENCDIGKNQANKSYTCREILYKGEKIKSTKESPVIIIGNSFIKTPMSKSEALPALLSYKLRSSVYWYRISGHSIFSVFLIQLLSNPDIYLKNKKVFIIQVGTMHLTNYNLNGTMLDIAKLDRERMILNNKKKTGSIFCDLMSISMRFLI